MLPVSKLPEVDTSVVSISKVLPFAFPIPRLSFTLHCPKIHFVLLVTLAHRPCTILTASSAILHYSHLLAALPPCIPRTEGEKCLSLVVKTKVARPAQIEMSNGRAAKMCKLKYKNRLDKEVQLPLILHLYFPAIALAFTNFPRCISLPYSCSCLSIFTMSQKRHISCPTGDDYPMLGPI